MFTKYFSILFLAFFCAISPVKANSADGCFLVIVNIWSLKTITPELAERIKKTLSNANGFNESVARKHGAELRLEADKNNVPYLNCPDVKSGKINFDSLINKGTITRSHSEQTLEVTYYLGGTVRETAIVKTNSNGIAMLFTEGPNKITIKIKGENLEEKILSPSKRVIYFDADQWNIAYDDVMYTHILTE
jgi:hypothetical protein